MVAAAVDVAAVVAVAGEVDVAAAAAGEAQAVVAIDSTPVAVADYEGFCCCCCCFYSLSCFNLYN